MEHLLRSTYTQTRAHTTRRQGQHRPARRARRCNQHNDYASLCGRPIHIPLIRFFYPRRSGRRPTGSASGYAPLATNANAVAGVRFFDETLADIKRIAPASRSRSTWTAPTTPAAVLPRVLALKRTRPARRRRHRHRCEPTQLDWTGWSRYSDSALPRHNNNSRSRHES